MRISDWSSDVCSADLTATQIASARPAPTGTGNVRRSGTSASSTSPRNIDTVMRRYRKAAMTAVSIAMAARGYEPAATAAADRQSGGRGKSVSVGVDLGGRGISKKKKKEHIHQI